MSGIVAAFTHPRIEAHMGKSTYEIRVAGTVPLDLARELPPDPDSRARWHDLARGASGRCRPLGLIDALRGAGVDLIEIRREISPDE
jgi:hypothetical protein